MGEHVRDVTSNDGSRDAGRRGPVVDVYARLSFAPGGETIKVDDQVDWCTEAVELRGGTVGEVFRDNSKSAWNPRVVRPQWEQLMRRLEAGVSDGMIVWDLTRFSRKVMEGERLIELADRGVQVWAQSGSYDLTTADGKRHFRDDMVTAAAESDKISERVRRGKRRRARRGRLAGGQRGYAMPGWLPAPPGWEPGDPREPMPAEVVQAERAVVKECYRRILAGEPLMRVVADLDTRGIRNQHGKRWTAAGLGRSLCRPALAGLVAHGGKIIGALADGQAGADGSVVSREQWERMCGLFASRRRGRPAGQGPHLLSGLLRCGRCGNTMQGRPLSHLAPYEDGSPRREYRCRWAAGTPGQDRRRGCAKVGIDAVIAELAVAEATKRRLGDPRRAERIAAHLSTVREERGKLSAELSALNESADTLAGKVAAWGVQRVDKAMEPILTRITAINAELGELDEPEDGHVAAADAARAWDDAMAAEDWSTLRAMVRRAFPKLTVRPQARRGDHSVDRFDFDGTSLPD